VLRFLSYSPPFSVIQLSGERPDALPLCWLAPRLYHNRRAVISYLLCGFSPAASGPYFLEGLRGAAMETELASIAETRLLQSWTARSIAVLSDRMALRRSLDGLYASLLENIRFSSGAQ